MKKASREATTKATTRGPQAMMQNS
jgi:hypothetical protein